jgi:hypothetical protein
MYNIRLSIFVVVANVDQEICLNSVVGGGAPIKLPQSRGGKFCVVKGK